MFYLLHDCCVEMLFWASGAPRQGASKGINQWGKSDPVCDVGPWGDVVAVFLVFSCFFFKLKEELINEIYFKKDFLLKPVRI